MTDVAIIGAYGSAGVAAAQTLAEDPDVSLSLIDGGPPGGLCILDGCMPSKDILSVGAHRHEALADERLAGELTIDIDAIVDRKDEHVADFARHREAAVHSLAEQENVTLFNEHARFVDNRILDVGDTRLEPDYVVIATGSTVNIPAIPGIDAVDTWTSKDVLDARSFPETGIVLGFGAIGLELVPYLADIGGMDLTVIEHDDRPLDNAPPKLGEWVLEYYEDAYGVDILTETWEQSLVRNTDGSASLTVDGPDGIDSVDGDVVFLFTGRTPAIDGLGLSQTALEHRYGWVSATMQSVDDEQIFIVGDANGERPILHNAKEEGFLAGRNILAHAADEPLERYSPIPHQVIFSGLGTYPFVQVGTLPSEAPEAIVTHRSASDDGVFRVKGVAEGHASLVVESTGRIIGYTGIHHHADVMAKTMQIIIERGLHVWDVPDRAFHPTTPEILDGLLRDASERLNPSDM